MNSNTKKIVFTALLTAIVIVLQSFGAIIKFGPFSISLVLVPIVVGAALCGKLAGAWLGAVFSVIVLVSGDAAPFWAINPIATIFTVLAKGILCGFIGGLVYEMIAKKNRTAGIFSAALVCPIVNTGVFLICCFLFFFDAVCGWAVAAGFEGNVGKYIVFIMVGGNFLIETAVNLIISPAIVRIINLQSKGNM